LLELRLAELDHGWSVLSAHVMQHHPDLHVQRGVELMLDSPEPRITDPRLRLAGGTFVLCEFPFMTIPPRSPEVVADLCARDCQPIIAHPERYVGFAPDYSLAEQWRRQGGYLQVNGASLLGKYGPQARALAFGLLERGWVDYLGSDYHARGNPAVRAYCELLIELGGGEQAQLLTRTNPSRILLNELPLPVPPLPLKRSLWGRVAELFRSP
jgi:protein-tyrosine phosphatase